MSQMIMALDNFLDKLQIGFVFTRGKDREFSCLNPDMYRYELNGQLWTLVFYELGVRMLATSVLRLRLLQENIKISQSLPNQGVCG